MTMFDFEKTLQTFKDGGAYRTVCRADVSGSRITLDGRNYTSFAGNDYLGISGRTNWQREFLFRLADSPQYQMGSLSSRLLGCNSSAFADFEDFAANCYSRQCSAEKKCLLFNCGYHANSGIIPALARKGDLVVADKLSHASLIDALRLTEAQWLRFPHNDFDRLDEILRRRRGEFGNVFIATEAVFSMDGDLCDIPRLVEIGKKYGAFLYVDEAHSFGLYGGGLGLCAQSGLLGEIDLVMCTLGKAAASEGAFAVCSPETREMLVNKCRTFIFSTALSPIGARWSKFVFEKILSMDAEREHLRNISRLFAEKTGAAGMSQIVPVVVGDENRAVKLAEHMREAGFISPAIRPPTVPKNSSRLRFSFSAAHTAEEVLAAAQTLENALKGGL